MDGETVTGDSQTRLTGGTSYDIVQCHNPRECLLSRLKPTTQMAMTTEVEMETSAHSIELDVALARLRILV